MRIGLDVFLASSCLGTLCTLQVLSSLTLMFFQLRPSPPNFQERTLNCGVVFLGLPLSLFPSLDRPGRRVGPSFLLSVPFLLPSFSLDCRMNHRRQVPPHLQCLLFFSVSLSARVGPPFCPPPPLLSCVRACVRACVQEPIWHARARWSGQKRWATRIRCQLLGEFLLEQLVMVSQSSLFTTLFPSPLIVWLGLSCHWSL